MKAIAQYTDKNNTTTSKDFDFDGTRQGFLQEASRFLLDAAIPGQLTILFPHSSIIQAVFKITKRGTYKENGVTYPSMYIPVFEVNHEAALLPSNNELYTKRYLTCIHPESNNYKAYSLEIEGDKLLCKYGSIDDMSNGKFRSVTYEPDLYWVRYYEKLSKGYIDQSEILLANKEEKQTKPTTASFTHPLYEELYSYAKKQVDTLLINPAQITARQIQECRTIWNSLGTETSLNGFNRLLEKLIVLSPRRRRPLQDDVKMYFASSNSDFKRIIDFEDGLISSLESKYYGEQNALTHNSLPIIADATKGMRDRILSTLPDDIARRVDAIYNVVDTNRRQIFDLYCEERNITNIKKLWHGSRNENWLSIIKNGLLLNPNAIITGKMFGNGIYFAPNPKKSYGYTSCQGTYWANGSSSVGFMGLYDTAVGDPYYPTTHGGLRNGDEMVKIHKKDCLYALSQNTGLYNDEVVFYNEAAICLSYLVKIKN